MYKSHNDKIFLKIGIKIISSHSFGLIFVIKIKNNSEKVYIYLEYVKHNFFLQDIEIRKEFSALFVYLFT